MLLGSQAAEPMGVLSQRLVCDASPRITAKNETFVAFYVEKPAEHGHSRGLWRDLREILRFRKTDIKQELIDGRASDWSLFEVVADVKVRILAANSRNRVPASWPPREREPSLAPVLALLRKLDIFLKENDK